MSKYILRIHCPRVSTLETDACPPPDSGPPSPCHVTALPPASGRALAQLVHTHSPGEFTGHTQRCQALNMLMRTKGDDKEWYMHMHVHTQTHTEESKGLCSRAQKCVW